MCVVIAKYFEGIGWAGCKNRDRNYTPILDFTETVEDGLSRMMMHDQITGYKEGINSHGVSILNASLDVGDDEKEVDTGKAKSSPDGRDIAEALLKDNPRDAVKVLLRTKLGGNTLVFDRETCYLIEASDKDGTAPFRFKVKEIPKDSMVARSNHGIWLPWAGYQRGRNKEETLDRISSETRLLIAQEVLRRAEDPQDLIDGMCQVYLNDIQLNIMRMNIENKKMRTTSQEMCVPSEKTLYCRPISSHLEFDYWHMNRTDTDVWVEVLSNRALYHDVTGEPPFGRLNLKDIG